jgi:exodeoxyribonuclease VII large subunit
LEPIKNYILLSDLTFLIEETVYTTFSEKALWIIAETSDIKNYADRQYCFISLVEKTEKGVVAKMDAVIWRSNYPIIKAFEKNTDVKFDKNLKLLLLVNVQFNAQYGLKLQIIDIDYSYTLGNLALERKTILDNLVALNPKIVALIDGNYVTRNKKIEKPLVIQNIALITAPHSDGQRDFKHELANNPYKYKFSVTEYLCQIQGKNAAIDIKNQIENIQLSGIKFDAIAIVRGGGSQVDFGAFDNYEVALAVAACSIPILTGIGHERNISIADLMSSESVKTPTKAASFIIEHNRNFEQIIINFKEDLIDKTKSVLENKAKEFYNYKDVFIYTLEKLLQKKNYLLHEKRMIVKHLDPINILKKGYAIILKNKKIISNPSEIKAGDTIEVLLKENSIESTVNKINNSKL